MEQADRKSLGPLPLHKSPTVREIFIVVVNVSLPISIGLAERPLGPTAATRFGHDAVGHDRLLKGVDLNHRTTVCREHPHSALKSRPSLPIADLQNLSDRNREECNSGLQVADTYDCSLTGSPVVVRHSQKHPIDSTHVEVHMPVQVEAEAVDEGDCANAKSRLVHIRRTGEVGR